MEDLTKRMAGLPLDKRKQLERLLYERLQQSKKLIPRRDATRAARLSFAQERLWFLHEFYPGLVAYNESSAYLLNGDLNYKALEDSINLLFKRHEILRSTFSEISGVPHQTVQPYHEQPLVYDDLTSSPHAERLPMVRERMQVEINRPFDLQKDQMLRVHLYRMDSKEHILLMVRHHIVSDGWSVRQMIEEITGALQALTLGIEPDLPELHIQYADFAEWERAWLQGKKLDDLVDYWRQKLAGLPPLELPVDYSYPAQPAFLGGLVTFSVPENILRGLRTLALQENVTLFMVLLAAFQVLLYRYSGQDDFAIGAPVAGRHRPELESLIGFFADNLVLRSNLLGKPTFRELLHRVRATCLEAFDHQDLPFAKVVEQLNPERRMHRNPLFEVSFQLRSAYQPLQLESLHVTRFDLEKTHSKFDLEMEIEELPDGLAGDLIYDRGLFTEDTVLRIAKNFEVLLGAISADPDQSVNALNLLTESERRLVVETWNQTELEWHPKLSVPELFESWAIKSPDSAAVVAGDQTLSNAQLNSRANQLARFLCSLGVGAETLVGLMLERSPEMIIGILAALKAGGAYLPLDPDYPNERLEYMLSDSGAAVLITNSRLADRIKPGSVPVVLLDTSQEVIDNYSIENLAFPRSPHSMVYMIYTSGSTGLPKGVIVEDVGLANLVHAMREITGWGPGDRVLQFSSLNFDISVEEIFGALCNGATLVLRNELMLESVAAFLDENQKFGVTIWDLPTAFWHLVTLEGSEQKLRIPESLRQVISGGERMHPDLTAIWKEWAGEYIGLFNFYGPTETSVAVSCADLAGSAQKWRGRREIPIGRPLPNVRVYILDDLQQPCPVGVVGELYVGGVGVGRGYWQRQDLTAQMFLPDPFFPGGRMYRTGDRARRLLDGQVEFAGRADHQIKVHGFRVELGEIETIIRQFPGVKDCAVIPRQVSTQEIQLVACVVPFEHKERPVSDLRKYLQGKLPEYMLPAAILFLDELSLTLGGKIDRKSLADLIFEADEQEYIAPRTDTEARLAQIWKQVMGLETVSVHDNFFYLGGHSLLAMQIMARIRKVFSVELSLRMLFESPTIAGLAEWVELLRNLGDDFRGEAGTEQGEILDA